MKKNIKTAETTEGFIDNEMADKIASSPQNSLETAESETENTGFDRDVPKEKYISQKKRKKRKKKRTPKKPTPKTYLINWSHLVKIPTKALKIFQLL